MKKYWIDIVLALAIAVLFILYFRPAAKTAEPAADGTQAAAPASLIDSQIAYIEIDSIVPNYHMYIDLTAELEKKQNQKEADLNTKAQKFQADPQFYVTGDAGNLDERASWAMYFN